MASSDSCHAPYEDFGTSYRPLRRSAPDPRPCPILDGDGLEWKLKDTLAGSPVTQPYEGQQADVKKVEFAKQLLFFWSLKETTVWSEDLKPTSPPVICYSKTGSLEVPVGREREECPQAPHVRRQRSLGGGGADRSPGEARSFSPIPRGRSPAPPALVRRQASCQSLNGPSRDSRRPAGATAHVRAQSPSQSLAACPVVAAIPSWSRDGPGEETVTTARMQSCGSASCGPTHVVTRMQSCGSASLCSARTSGSYAVPPASAEVCGQPPRRNPSHSQLPGVVASMQPALAVVVTAQRASRGSTGSWVPPSPAVRRPSLPCQPSGSYTGSLVAPAGPSRQQSPSPYLLGPSRQQSPARAAPVPRVPNRQSRSARPSRPSPKKQAGNAREAIPATIVVEACSSSGTVNAPLEQRKARNSYEGKIAQAYVGQFNTTRLCADIDAQIHNLDGVRRIEVNTSQGAPAIPGSPSPKAKRAAACTSPSSSPVLGMPPRLDPTSGFTSAPPRDIASTRSPSRPVRRPRNTQPAPVLPQSSPAPQERRPRDSAPVQGHTDKPPNRKAMPKRYRSPSTSDHGQGFQAVASASSAMPAPTEVRLAPSEVPLAPSEAPRAAAHEVPAVMSAEAEAVEDVGLATKRTIDEEVIRGAMNSPSALTAAYAEEFRTWDTRGTWMILMVNLIARNSNEVTSLDFRNFSMPTKEQEPRIAPRLLLSLSTNTHLKELLLHCSNLQATDEFGQVLAANNTLEVLDVQCNFLKPSNLEALFAGLANNTTLKELRCADQFAAEKADRSVFIAADDALQKNFTLQKLGLEVCRATLCGQHYQGQIDRALIRNTEVARKKKKQQREAKLMQERLQREQEFHTTASPGGA